MKKRLKKGIKRLLLTFLIFAIVIVAFVYLYKPFGGVPSKEMQEQYEKQMDTFYDGTFHTQKPSDILAQQESEFTGERKIPNGEIPVHELTEIPAAGVEDLNWIWFGHSSSMLQIQGKNVLIDPVFSEYASPIQAVACKRFSKVPISMEDMPEIDVMVLSHDHYDHLDYGTIKEMDSKVKEYVVPLGVECHLVRWGVDAEKIHSVAWWDEVSIGDLTIISTPGQHYTSRLPWNQNKTLWCGYVLRGTKYTAYFTGDTGYGDHFEEIHEKIGAIDFMMLENGQYDNRWAAIHMHPEQGIEAVKTLQPTWVVPVHWGTFCICNHPWDESIKEITRLAQENNISIATPKIGEIVPFDSIESFNERWWEEVEKDQ